MNLILARNILTFYFSFCGILKISKVTILESRSGPYIYICRFSTRPYENPSLISLFSGMQCLHKQIIPWIQMRKTKTFKYRQITYLDGDFRKISDITFCKFCIKTICTAKCDYQIPSYYFLLKVFVFYQYPVNSFIWQNF